MTNDTLTRARAVLEGLRAAEGRATPGPWEWEEYGGGIYGGDAALAATVPIVGLESTPRGRGNALAIVALRNAAPALIRLAEAELAGRAAWTDARKARSQSLADADYAEAYKRGQAAAAAVDAALAELAALAPQEDTP